MDSFLFALASPQRTPLGHAAHLQVRHSAHECQRRRLYLPQGIEPHHDRIEHRKQVSPCVEGLPVAFSAGFRADSEDFVPVEILAELREDRLSGKKCTFGHSVLFPFVLW